MQDFHGKTVVIAGASSGIGRETAQRLSEQGAKIVLVARREDKLQEACAGLSGEGHSWYVFDFSDLDNIDSLFKQIVAEQGKIDGFVYAAGISKTRPIAQIKPNVAKEVFNINFFGFLESIRQIARGRFNPGLRIVGISSIAAARGDSGHTIYSASKAAMDGAVRCLAMELAGKGICINTVAPAMTNTEMYQKFVSSFGESGESNSYLFKRQYLGLGEPSDIANTIIFLLSSESRFITGACIPVDGGYTSD